MENTGCWAWGDIKKMSKVYRIILTFHFIAIVTISQQNSLEYGTKLIVAFAKASNRSAQENPKSNNKMIKSINVLHLYNCETQRYLSWMQYEQYDFAYCLWCARVYSTCIRCTIPFLSPNVLLFCARSTDIKTLICSAVSLLLGAR